LERKNQLARLARQFTFSLVQLIVCRRGCVRSAMKLQRPSPDGVLKIIGSVEREGPPPQRLNDGS
jgi:hypothetical protein